MAKKRSKTESEVSLQSAGTVSVGLHLPVRTETARDLAVGDRIIHDRKGRRGGLVVVEGVAREMRDPERDPDYDPDEDDDEDDDDEPDEWTILLVRDVGGSILKVEMPSSDRVYVSAAEGGLSDVVKKRMPSPIRGNYDADQIERLIHAIVAVTEEAGFGDVVAARLQQRLGS